MQRKRRPDSGNHAGKNAHNAHAGNVNAGSDTAQRLNKAVAAAGFCSRRKADEYIFAGRIAVNDQTETNPARQVLADDRISIDGRVLRRSQPFLYYMLHKPVQIVCTLHDPQGRPTILSLLPEELRQARVYPVGRLDYFSEGALLLTNDGQWANRLMHPRHHVPKEYEVTVRGRVDAAFLERARRGMRLSDGTPLLPVEIEAVGLPRGDTQLRMVLHQGINRQIRRMCADGGLTILRLRRVRIGRLELGTLPRGKVRPLTEEEIARLSGSETAR